MPLVLTMGAPYVCLSARLPLLLPPAPASAARLFDAVAVAGDSLLAVLQFLDPADAGRSLMVMDLQSKKNRTIPLVSAGN